MTRLFIFTLAAANNAAVLPLSQGEAFAAALKRVGVEHEFEAMPDAPHTFDLQPEQCDCDLRLPVLGFLDKHLKSANPLVVFSPRR